MTKPTTRAKSPRYRGLSYRKPIDAANEAVTVLEVAEEVCKGEPKRRRGQEVYFKCPLHDDNNPSLRVSLAKNRWFCDPCLKGGDALELFRLVRGFTQREAHFAAVELLLSFGFEIPQRPATWFARQQRQAPARERAERLRVEHVRELIYRLIWMPWLRRLPERQLETAEASAWEESLEMARLLYASRRSA